MDALGQEEGEVRDHLIEQLERHLDVMRSNTSHDHSLLDSSWAEFRERVSNGDFGHEELDSAVNDLYQQIKKPPTL